MSSSGLHGRAVAEDVLETSLLDEEITTLLAEPRQVELIRLLHDSRALERSMQQAPTSQGKSGAGTVSTDVPREEERAGGRSQAGLPREVEGDIQAAVVQCTAWGEVNSVMTQRLAELTQKAQVVDGGERICMWLATLCNAQLQDQSWSAL